MSTINDGGLAFPASRFERTPDRTSLSGFASVEVHYPGMTLRDWFAGQYLAGNSWQAGTMEDHARDAYRAADAMIAARALASAGQS